MKHILFTTTRSRARAFADSMQHEHVSYTPEGQLVLAFLKDLERALARCPEEPEVLEGELVCEHEWQEQPGEPPVDTCSRCGEVRE
jgi:hypothetical protein